MKKLICCNSASIYESFSQGSPLRAGMKFNLNEDGSKYGFVGTKFGFVLAMVNYDWRRSQLLGTDIGNRRLRFLAYSQISKIHDCDTLWYQQSNLHQWRQDLLELVGMEPERNQEYFSTMPGTNTRFT
jgi:hypothetical protein